MQRSSRVCQPRLWAPATAAGSNSHTPRLTGRQQPATLSLAGRDSAGSVPDTGCAEQLVEPRGGDKVRLVSVGAISEAQLIQYQSTPNFMSQKVWVAALREGGPPTLQACDLHLWCAVRELNPQPADSDYSSGPRRRMLWKPLCRNEIPRFSPLDIYGQLSSFVVKTCGEKCVCWLVLTHLARGPWGCRSWQQPSAFGGVYRVGLDGAPEACPLLWA